MSFLFRCARRRDELASPSVRTNQRFVHLEQEVIRLHTEIESLKQHIISANEKTNVGASSYVPCAHSASLPSLSENKSNNITTITPPALLFPLPKPSPQLSSPVPLPPLAPPFTPLLNNNTTNSSIFTPLPSIHNDILSPDGQISTCSLVSALDSIIVTVQPPSPPKPSFSTVSSSVSSTVSSITSTDSSSSRLTRRALRPLTSSPGNRFGLNPAELANVTLRKPRSARKNPEGSQKPAKQLTEKGITLDAILNVKLRAATRSQRKSRKTPFPRKRGRKESPSDKENVPVESFFQEALRKKFKRIREQEQQEEADDIQW